MNVVFLISINSLVHTLMVANNNKYVGIRLAVFVTNLDYHLDVTSNRDSVNILFYSQLFDPGSVMMFNIRIPLFKYL
jgi:hypothetical protein